MKYQPPNIFSANFIVKGYISISILIAKNLIQMLDPDSGAQTISGLPFSKEKAALKIKISKHAKEFKVIPFTCYITFCPASHRACMYFSLFLCLF